LKRNWCPFFLTATVLGELLLKYKKLHFPETLFTFLSGLRSPVKRQSWKETWGLFIKQ
jgi:hypothetical protein